jgi:hypothetical protein
MSSPARAATGAGEHRLLFERTGRFFGCDEVVDGFLAVAGEFVGVTERNERGLLEKRLPIFAC